MDSYGIPSIPLLDFRYFGLQRALLTGVLEHLFGFLQVMSQKVLVRRSHGIPEVVMKLILLYWFLTLFLHDS